MSIFGTHNTFYSHVKIVDYEPDNSGSTSVKFKVLDGPFKGEVITDYVIFNIEGGEEWKQILGISRWTSSVRSKIIGKVFQLEFCINTYGVKPAENLKELVWSQQGE